MFLFTVRFLFYLLSVELVDGGSLYGWDKQKNWGEKHGNGGASCFSELQPIYPHSGNSEMHRVFRKLPVVGGGYREDDLLLLVQSGLNSYI